MNNKPFVSKKMLHVFTGLLLGAFCFSSVGYPGAGTRPFIQYGAQRGVAGSLFSLSRPMGDRLARLEEIKRVPALLGSTGLYETTGLYLAFKKLQAQTVTSPFSKREAALLKKLAEDRIAGAAVREGLHYASLELRRAISRDSGPEEDEVYWRCQQLLESLMTIMIWQIQCLSRLEKRDEDCPVDWTDYYGRFQDVGIDTDEMDRAAYEELNRVENDSHK